MIMPVKALMEAGTSTHEVLKLLYEFGPQRQGDIAGRLNITNSACNQHFRKLAEENLIIPGEEQMNQRGRPSQFWRLQNQGNYFMGILFYSSSLTITLADFAGEMVYHETTAISDKDNTEKLLAQLEEAVAKVCREIHRSGGNILQTFICVGGTVTSEGEIENSPYFPGLNGVFLEKELQARFGLNVYCDGPHYANVHGETRELAADSTALIMDWGEGLCGNVVNNYNILNFAVQPSKLNRGLWNLGHVPIAKEGRACYCGNRGCLETYTGGLALLKYHPELGCRTIQEFVTRINAGDPAVLAVIREAAGVLAESLYWLLELFGVDTIIFVGNFCQVFPKFEAEFREGLQKMRTKAAADRIHLMASGNPLENIQIGTALMARHVFFYPDEPRKSRGAFRRNQQLS